MRLLAALALCVVARGAAAAEPDHYETRVPGGILVGTGASLAVASGVALVLRLGEGQRVALAPQPGGALLRLALRF